MLLLPVRNLMIKQVNVGESRIKRAFQEMRKPNYAIENATVFRSKWNVGQKKKNANNIHGERDR